jgi:hypothetical protein
VPGLADEFLPVYDVSDEVATVVHAEPRAVWDALVRADLIALGRRAPLVGVLGAIRLLPELAGHLLHGERPPRAPASMTLHDMAEAPRAEGGWLLLGERPGSEIALGLVGKFWRPVIEYADVTADQFRPFSEPNFAKTVYELGIRPVEGGSLLSALMRTATTDERARAWFRRYWAFGVGSGAHVLAQALIDSVREDAEREPE